MEETSTNVYRFWFLPHFSNYLNKMPHNYWKMRTRTTIRKKETTIHMLTWCNYNRAKYLQNCIPAILYHIFN